MRAIIVGWCLVATVAPEILHAQEGGFLMSVGGPVSSLSGVFYSPPGSGQYFQLATFPGHPLIGRPWAALPGNRHFLLWDQRSTGPVLDFSLFDRDSATHLPYILTVPSPVPPNRVDMLVDQEGDLIISIPAPFPAPGGVYKLTPVGTLTPVTRGTGGLWIDLDTGDYIVAENLRLARVSRGVTTTIAPISNQETICQDPETGEFLVWNSNVLLKITASGTVTSTAFYGSYYPSVMAVDESPAAAGGEYVFNTTYVAAMQRAPRSGGMVTTLLRFPAYSPPAQGMTGIADFALDRARNVSTASAGIPNSWNVFVDFPNDANAQYLLLVGASGIRPGITLPDGRKIRLNPDAVTAMGLAGALPGFGYLSGTLDGRGTAVAVANLSWLGPAAAGAPFWMVGLVLGPTPPVIRRVSPPVVVQIR